MEATSGHRFAACLGCHAPESIFVHHRSGKLGLGTAYLWGFDWALARAYQVAVAAIAAQRKGQTAVFRLKFETPADEYEYERKRNGSYSMLIDIMMDERPSPPP